MGEPSSRVNHLTNPVGFVGFVIWTSLNWTESTENEQNPYDKQVFL
jgi:hypothetical protein